MNVKRWFIGSIVVFIIFFLLGMLFHGVCLSKYYEDSDLWRSDEDMHLWMIWLTQLITAFLFCYIYSKGYEEKSSRAAEGLRYGFIIGLFVTIPMSVNMYATMPISGRLAFYWFIMGMFAYLLTGLVVGLIYKKAESTTT